MSKHAEILAALEAPFPADVVRTRPGMGGGTLSWVPARVVAARLDAVVGISGWDFDVDVMEDGKTVRGTLTIRFGDGTQASRADYGCETGGSGETLKEAASDALRRCASLFGVARYLYGKEGASAGGKTASQPVPARAPQAPVTDDAILMAQAARVFAESQAGDGCSHGTPWTLKPAGVSKVSGKPYSAFWTASHKLDDGSGYCKEKPSIKWLATHPAEPKSAPTDLEEMPF